MTACCNACGERLAAHAETIHGQDRLHSLPGAYTVVACASCGSGTTLPDATEDDLPALYPNEYNAYGLPRNRSLRAAATALFRWRHRRALRRHPLQDADRRYARILDVGGGRGDLALTLSRRGADVTVLEPSEAACAVARSRGLRAIRGTLAVIDAADLGKFDALVFQHSLEHVAAPRDALEAARQLLTSSGVLLITLPNFDCAQRRRFGTHWFHLDLPRHRTHFSPRGLTAALHATGFVDIHITTSTSPDGFAMSQWYRIRETAPRTMTTRLIASAAAIASSPLVAAAGHGGDVLHASCRSPN